MWLGGQLVNIKGRVWIEADAVGANRYINTKFIIEPTTSVENTKSNSLSPKLGLDAISPRTLALTPTNSSIRTLKGNCGSAATLDLHPLTKAPIGPILSQEDFESSESPPLLQSPLPPPPLPLPIPILPPSPPPTPTQET
ncbi:hypothetical protein H5410_052768 [Solanum commersonii]|uniref:Uncharacterized protein n=1 Tax=Solanum commersonii TaxID=4109 RepID=A0A9J5X410_SOLCO|nr:hypothetical protein H5410_052768 [Solanum commersonii]